MNRVVKNVDVGYVARLLRIMAYYVKYLLGLILLFTFHGLLLAADVWIDFDDLPATAGTNEVPGSSNNWIYMSPYSASYTVDTCGWISSVGYTSSPNIHNSFKWYLNGYNTAHMGFSTYGFLDIDESVAVKGHSLRLTITGGKDEDGCENVPCQHGLEVLNKEQYLDYLNNGVDPVASDGESVGCPTIYFMNNSLNFSPIPFPEAQGANRMSLYVKLPPESSVGDGGWGSPPQNTMHIAPFITSGNGSHWYCPVDINGGAWVHILVDTHPGGNNSHNYSYPSRSIRDLGVEFFNELYKFYIEFLPVGGVASPRYNVWIDEVKFYYDPEPQNEETINIVAVSYHEEEKRFEIDFHDKYTDNMYSYSTYEVRYSFSPITNDNWDLAKPVHVLSHSGFHIDENYNGTFEKWWPYYTNVWASFRLREEDESKLVPGTTVYFAIKDISQIDGNGLDPVASSYRGEGRGGRDYRNHGDTFDYEGDKNALLLIKRIDYYIPEENTSQWAAQDINQDGSVDINDVQLVVNVILGKAENSRADVNRDGSVTISDTQEVVNSIIG